MPSQAQKHISKAQRKLAVGWVREELEQGVAKGDIGAQRRRDDFEEFQGDEAGDWQMAIPWMEGGDLHMSDVEEMYNYVLAFGGMLPADLIPQGLGDLPTVPEGEHAEDVQLQRVVLLRDHLDKILESDNPSAKNPRREIHDRIVGVCAAMQRNVGIQLVVEDRGYDWGAGGDEHHRPDMTAVGGVGQSWVEDVTLMRWARVAKMHAKKDASLEETRAGEAMKVEAYRKLMARENEKRDDVGLERDEFKPLAFAARTGKWGETMREVWRELEEAGKRKGMSADMWANM